LFLEVLVLCREAGLLKVGRLSLDGTKIKANDVRQTVPMSVLVRAQVLMFG